jgi:hypothetical protein
LEGNKWIYFVPSSKSIAILCEDKPPTDIIVSGIGKLGISKHCKGFGRSADFQTHSILNVEATGYDGDFLSTVDLEYDLRIFKDKD